MKKSILYFQCFLFLVFSTKAQTLKELVVEKAPRESGSSLYTSTCDPALGVLVFQSAIPGLQFKLNMPTNLINVEYDREMNEYVLCVKPTDRQYWITITGPEYKPINIEVKNVEKGANTDVAHYFTINPKPTNAVQIAHPTNEESKKQLIVERTHGEEIYTNSCNSPALGVLVFKSAIEGLTFKLNMPTKLVNVSYIRQQSKYVLCVEPTERQYWITISHQNYESFDIDVRYIHPSTVQFFTISTVGTYEELKDALAIEKKDFASIYKDRLMILDFVEKFRIALNRKDLKFLDNAFANNESLIIDKVQKTRVENNVEYVNYTKSKYLENLSNVFLRNSYINIKFSEIEVMQHDGNSNIYGVTLKQDWNTTNYKDVGWLFLMIEIRDEDNPLIWVRTWQPISVSKNDLFGLDNFILR